MYHIFLIHSSVDGHLGCFLVLTTANNAAINIGSECIFLNYSFVKIYAQQAFKVGILELFFPSRGYTGNLFKLTCGVP